MRFKFFCYLQLLFFSCQVKDVESLCRAPVNECDVPEYCTGLSKHCPENDFKMNGIPCSSGQGYCYNGQCPTHFQHCQRLWGTGTQSLLPNPKLLQDQQTFYKSLESFPRVLCSEQQQVFSTCQGLYGL